MAWGGGGWLIWRNGSLRNSASQPPSRRSAGSCEPWATANYRPDRVTMRKPRARSRILKKLPRAPGGNCAQEGACPRHDRNLVRRRGPHRPEEQDHPPLGQARHPSKRTAGPTHRFHLHLRCSLPEGGQGCSPDHAGLQHRGDELAPRRDRRNRRARCPRHPPGRSSRLALVHAPPRAGQYHHHSAAAEVPRAQPGRERLAVHARQLALQPHLQILRRSRRPLLCGMEQARRPALAHHVHRTAPMGPRVLINGIWYNMATSGFWWWPLAPNRRRFYEKIHDLEKNLGIELDDPSFNIFIHKQPLTDVHMQHLTLCLVALPGPNDQERAPPYTYYLGGLTFIALNSIQWRCEGQAFGNFLESLRLLMVEAKYINDGESIDVAASRFLKEKYPDLDPPEHEAFLQLIRRFDRREGTPVVKLADVYLIKLLCETIFRDAIIPAVMQSKSHKKAEP